MKILLRYLVLVVMMLCLQVRVVSALTYDWIGNAATGSKTDWNNILNWQVPGVLGLPSTPTTPPTLTDPVNIGLLSFSNPPAVLVNTTATCASITFGALIPSLLSSVINFKVDGALTVSGDIFQSAALLNNYTVILSGGGKVDCLGNLKVGDPSIFLNNILTATTNVLTFASTLTNFNIAKDVTVSGTTFGINLIIVGLILGEVDATFSLRGGTTSIGGKILTTNTSGGILNNSKAIVKFYVEPSSGNAILKLAGATPIDQTSLAASVDFYKSTGTGTCTVEYNDDDNTAGAIQTVYASTDPILDNSPTTYNYLTMSGRTTKRVNSGTLLVDKDWISGGGVVNMTTFNPVANIGGNWTNAATVNQGSGKITITGSVINNSGGTLNLGTADLQIGTNYTNNIGGIYNQSSGTTLFTSANPQLLNDFTSTGTKFNNVTFTGTGLKTMKQNTGKDFWVNPLYTLKVNNGSSLTVENTNTAPATSTATSSALTISSTAAGDASIGASIGGIITGNINVQRYIKGGFRRYMLLSSPVSNVTAATTNNGTSNTYNYTYNLFPIRVNTYITGLGGSAGGSGFDDAPNTGNSPSVFVYDENAPVTANVNLVLGNEYKPFNSLKEQLPAGNGFMFYFRGLRGVTQNPFSSPFPPADNTTLNFFGGVIIGKDAGGTGQFTANIINFPNTVPNDYTASAVTFGSLSFHSTTASIKQGLNLIGNPYASALDLKLLYSGNGNKYKFFYMLIMDSPTGTNSSSTKFATYDASSTAPPPDGTSQFALSGQGFFTLATAANSALVFNENMKAPYSSYLNAPSTKPVFNVKHDPINVLAKSAVSRQENNAQQAPANNSTTSDDAIPRLRLELVKDSIIHNTTDINFDKTASNKFVSGEDGPYFQPSGQGDIMYSLTADSVGCFANYAGNLETLKRVDLRVDFSNYGLYKITSPYKVNIDERYVIYLKDKYTKDSLDIVHNSEYAFNIDKNPASYAYDRFYLSIGIAPGHEYKLLGFSGSKVTAGIQLTWKTDNESNFTRFRVEKSTNGGKSFVALDSLQSTGKGSYTTTDSAPGTGQISYRLIQTLVTNDVRTSKSLTFDYSDITRLLTFMIYPSNTAQDIHIRLGKTYNNNIKINIVSSTGSLVKTFSASNTDVVQQNVGNLLTGLYIVDAIDETTGKRIGSGKFFKQ